MRSCKHCRGRTVSRPWGLCRACYSEPGLRQRHSAVDLCHGTREVLDRCGGYDLPRKPSAARPGTPEKIDVLAERARAGVMLFHPGDCEPD